MHETYMKAFMNEPYMETHIYRHICNQSVIYLHIWYFLYASYMSVLYGLNSATPNTYRSRMH